MSVKKTSLSAHNNNRQVVVEDSNHAAANGTKRGRFGKWFSFKEVSMEPNKSLEKQDSGKLKAEIKRWAKAVAAYARQVSGHLGLGSSSRKSSRIGSSSKSKSKSKSKSSSFSSSSSISPRIHGENTTMTLSL